MSIYTTPYTYLVRHKPTGKRYYGVRFARGCHPNDLWNTYFTSSKYVQELIEQDGPEAFECEIRRTFNKRRDAIAWEERVLQRLHVVEKDQWINRNDTKSIYYEVHPQLGKPMSEETKRRISVAKKGKKKGPMSLEQRTAISNGLKGLKKTPEHCANIAAAQRGHMRGPMGEAHKEAIRRGKLAQIKDSERQIALLNGDKKYHGNTCIVCGGTERYTSSRECVMRKSKNHGS